MFQKKFRAIFQDFFFQISKFLSFTCFFQSFVIWHLFLEEFFDFSTPAPKKCSVRLLPIQCASAGIAHHHWPDFFGILKKAKKKCAESWSKEFYQDTLLLTLRSQPIKSAGSEPSCAKLNTYRQRNPELYIWHIFSCQKCF